MQCSLLSMKPAFGVASAAAIGHWWSFFSSFGGVRGRGHHLSSFACNCFSLYAVYFSLLSICSIQGYWYLSLIVSIFLVVGQVMWVVFFILVAPMNSSTLDLPVHRLLPEVIQNSCPLSQWCHPTLSFFCALFPSSFNFPQHLNLFQWVISLHQVAKVLEFQLQCQFLQCIYSGELISFRIDRLDLLAV